jgi:hypothetical protein
MSGWCAVSKNGRRRWPCLELALKLSPEQMKAVSARRPNVHSMLVCSQHEFLSIRTIATAKVLQMHAAMQPEKLLSRVRHQNLLCLSIVNSRG